MYSCVEELLSLFPTRVPARLPRNNVLVDEIERIVLLESRFERPQRRSGGGADPVQILVDDGFVDVARNGTITVR
jgi:hypothetical protein